MFITGFDYVINKLKPKTVIVYGRMPKIFCLAKMHGIKLIPFESEFAVPVIASRFSAWHLFSMNIATAL